MSDNDSHDEGAAMRKSQRKITKKQVFELKDEPTIKRTKKFKTNPDGSPIVPGYPQTYHAVLADAVASGGLPLGTVMGAAAGADGAPASAAASAARAASLAQQQTSSKTSKRSNKLYCLCQKPYEQDQPMIRCDECHEWYHFSCLGVTDDASIAALEALDPYRCGRCMTGVTQKKPRKPATSGVGKKRKSKRNDDDDAASEEENDGDARRPIDPNDPSWVNPYADLLSDPIRCQQYSQSQLDQMRQFMNYNRAEYALLQQQIAAQQQQAAQMAQAQAAAAAQAQAQGAPAAAAAAGSAPASGTDVAAAAPAAAAAAAPDTKA